MNATQPTIVKKKGRLSGLLDDAAGDALSPSTPAAADQQALAPAGKPIMIDLDLIDEDPEQPRTAENPGFAPESIADALADQMPVWQIKKTSARKAAQEIRALAAYAIDKMENK